VYFRYNIVFSTSFAREACGISFEKGKENDR